MVENAGDFSTGESRHRISALVSGSPKLQLLDPTVSSGLLGCWGLGGVSGFRVLQQYTRDQWANYWVLTLEVFGLILGDLKP